MKFSDGQWLTRPGVTVRSPYEVHDLEIAENSVTVYAPCRHLNGRGDTLNGPLLTISLFSPLPEVIGVRITHFSGGLKHGPEFRLERCRDFKAVVTDSPTEVSLTSGSLRARINKGGEWSLEFEHRQRRITGSGLKSTGYITMDDGRAFVREQLDLAVGEVVYGLGERFTAFVKNGQAVEIWNRDGGTSTEQAYKNIPFYLTNRGYGVFVNHPEDVSFEVASEVVSKVQFSVAGEYLEYYIINGPTPKQVLANYTALTGRPVLPPAWTFGLWLTTSFTTRYDEATVNSFIDGMAQRDLALHVFHFDCFWMKEYHWSDFCWDERAFPEPEQMLSRLKAKRLKICLWINPYIAQRSPLFNEGREHGYLLKKADGTVWQWDLWQPGMAIVDFTNPEACRWFAAQLARLLEMGVDCFKTDFGERIPTDVVYSDGSDPVKMHNYYTYLYNQVVFELLQQKRGPGEAAVFARSATVGSQRFPIHWGGDCWARYESMAESLRGGLSLGLSGFGFWSHDIGGFENTATADLYKRWVAFGLLSSHSRLHGSSSYRVPWLFDEEAVTVLRYFTKLKCSLMPYLFAIAQEAAGQGIPVMRAMMLEFPEDPACDYLDRQYMLGDALLVAPVFNEAGTVSYYLPSGTWTSWLTGETVTGGCWRQEQHGYCSLPLLVRPNSLLASSGIDNRPDYDYAADVTLHLFELEAGRSVSRTVFNTQGVAELEVTVERNAERLSITAKGVGKPWSLLCHGIRQYQSIQGGTVVEGTHGLLVRPIAYCGRLQMELE